jgi:predicted lipoprotein with Yx(FWY)xxD motif
MEFVTMRGRIFLLVMSIILITLIIVINCRTYAISNSNTSDDIDAPSPTPDLRNMVVMTVKASVYGVEETILTDKNGEALYYSKRDTLSKVSCTNGCTYAWRPLLFKGKGPVITSTKLPGKLTTHKTVNGNQVAYNGHYLYTFAGDVTPQDVDEGQGRDDNWYVATPNLR